MIKQMSAVVAAAYLGLGAASAATVAVDITAAATTDISDFHGGTSPQGSGVTGNMGTGVAFDVGATAWSASPWQSQTGTATLTLTTSLFGVDRIQTLMNTLWGPADGNSTISMAFTGASGQTYTVNFFSGDDVRGWNYYPVYATTISNVGATNGIDAEAWWQRNPGATSTGWIDMQTIDLPASFLNDELVQIVLTDTGGPQQRRALLVAMNAVTSPVPVPGALVLFVGGLGLMARIRHRAG